VVAGVAGAASFTFAYGLQGVVQGLIVGLGGLAAPVIFSDRIAEMFYREDPLLTPRRVNIISFVWSLLSGVTLILAGAAAGLTGNPLLLLRGVMITVYTSIWLRAIIFPVFSSRGAAKTTLVILLQPTLMALVTFLLVPTVWQTSIWATFGALILVLLGPAVLLLQISKWSFDDGSLKIIPLFRAFIYAWAEEHSEPLEEQLVGISEETRLEADELVFRGSEGCIGRLVTPYVHPGPFRNVGSSGLSLAITEGLSDCETVVAHGVSSHEVDMARSGDMAKIVAALKEDGVQTSKLCSPMVRAEVSGAKASCQIFGDAALITLTLAPKRHDDIPTAVKRRIREAAAAHGLTAIVSDAHNCLDHEDYLDDKDAENLVAAAEDAMKKAIAAPKKPFKAGVSRVRPSEWGLKEGMGPCGICAVVIETPAGRNAYIVFDTNNMIQGFREELLAHVASLGYVEAEAMTSDTHLVNAIGATDRGYHPAGEAIDHAAVFRRVDEALMAAEPRPAEASFKRVAVDGIPIIGEKGIELLMGVVQTSFRVFARTAITALPLSFLAAVVVALLA